MDVYECESWGHEEAVSVKTGEDNDCCTPFSQIKYKFILSAESKGKCVQGWRLEESKRKFRTVYEGSGKS